MGAQGDHRFPGVDPDAHLELQLLVAPVQLLECLEDAQAGAHRALGVVLVSNGRAEHGHDGIADELLHGPAVAFDHALELGVIRAQPGTHVLGVGVLRGGGEPHQVAEEHRDHLALLADRSRGALAEGQPTEGAEREGAGELLGAVRAGGHVSSLAETGCARVAGGIHEGGAALGPPDGTPASRVRQEFEPQDRLSQSYPLHSPIASDVSVFRSIG